MAIKKTVSNHFTVATYSLSALTGIVTKAAKTIDAAQAAIIRAKVPVLDVCRKALGIPDESALVFADADELELRFDTLRKSDSYKKADERSQATVRQFFSICRKAAGYTKGKDGSITRRVLGAAGNRSPKHGKPETDAGKVQAAQAAKNWRDALAAVLKDWAKDIPANVQTAIKTAMIVKA